MTFSPVFEFQTQMMRCSMGELYWNEKKMFLKEAADDRKMMEAARLRQLAADAAKAAESQNEVMVKKRMGLRYYIMPWTREAERRKVNKILAITSDLDSK